MADGNAHKSVKLERFKMRPSLQTNRNFFKSKTEDENLQDLIKHDLEALKSLPSSYSLRMEIAAVYQKLGRLYESLALFKKAMNYATEEKEIGQGWNNLGVSWSRLMAYNKSEECARKGLEIASTSLKLFNYCMFLLRVGKFEETQTRIVGVKEETLMRMEKAFLETIRGYIELVNGKEAEAEKHFGKSLAMCSDQKEKDETMKGQKIFKEWWQKEKASYVFSQVIAFKASSFASQDCMIKQKHDPSF